MKKNRLTYTLLILISLAILSQSVIACKDIMAVGNVTEGDYNLLMKVRDPSRPGLQVLTIVPRGYRYDYRDPRTGKALSFTTTQSYIGVVTKGDTLPNIVKPGMALSDAGIAYGDADSGSFWVNHRKYAWDDFDWIRYACQIASNEDEAVKLLTKDVVDKMHAPGVSENLFVVGPEKGYVIEADAYRYVVNEIKDGIIAMSNYPKELWKTQKYEKLTISKKFDTCVEKYVRKGETLRLGSIFGIKILSIDEDKISVRPINFIHRIVTGSTGSIDIPLGSSKTVGYFRVKLVKIDGRKAIINVSNIYKAWEDKLIEDIIPSFGKLSVSDMISISRLHEREMDDLRPICEDRFEYEGVAIYKIPRDFYDKLSIGWFSPNHACSSIFVPFHVCIKDIYDPYKTGDAAQLSINLLNIYGHGYLSKSFNKIEKVFMNEVERAEEIAKKFITEGSDVSEFLTIIDTSMQRQAFLTQKIWFDISYDSNKEKLIEILDFIWKDDYNKTLSNLRELADNDLFYNSKSFKEYIVEVTKDICKSRIESAKVIGSNIGYAEEIYKEAEKLVEEGNYREGFYKLQQSYDYVERALKGKKFEKFILEKESSNLGLILLTLFVIFLIVLLILFSLKSRIRE